MSRFFVKRPIVQSTKVHLEIARGFCWVTLDFVIFICQMARASFCTWIEANYKLKMIGHVKRCQSLSRFVVMPIFFQHPVVLYRDRIKAGKWCFNCGFYNIFSTFSSFKFVDHQGTSFRS